MAAPQVLYQLLTHYADVPRPGVYDSPLPPERTLLASPLLWTAGAGAMILLLAIQVISLVSGTMDIPTLLERIAIYVGS